MRAFDDYEPDRQARDAYQQLLRREPGRVALRTMRHVHRVSFDDRNPDGADPANRMGLPPADPPGVSDGPHAGFRSMHFEQFGLWLARYATILIAAYAPPVAATRAPKPGSVPRVVAFRRTGIPDRFASEVIGRSQELFTSSQLEEPDGGHVLWIDPATPGAEEAPFHVLRPMDAIYDRHVPSPTQSQASGAVYAAPFDYSPAGARGPCKGAAAPLDAALAVARRFERLHAGQLLPLERLLGRWLAARLALVTSAGARFRRHPALLAGPDWRRHVKLDATEQPDAFLTCLRHEDAPLGRQERRRAARMRSVLRQLILLFIAAVLAHELYTELLPSRHAVMAIKIALVVLIALYAGWAVRAEISKEAEDLRGLREVLRVQAAWWGFGLDRMVDRVHLRSIDNDLKVIREMAATVATWAALRTTTPPPRPAASHKAATNWINGQVTYHGNRRRQQEGYKMLAEQGVAVALWTALLALAGMTALLWGVPALAGASFDRLPESLGRTELTLVKAAGALAWSLSAVAVAALVTAMVRAGHGAGRPILRFATYFLPEAPGASRLRFYLSAAPLLALTAAPCALQLVPHVLGPSRPLLRAALVTTWIGILACQCAARVPWDVKDWRIWRMRWPGYLACTTSTTFFIIGTCAALAPAAALLNVDRYDAVEGFRALMLITTTLVLAIAGMLGYYVERRNHSAQAAQSDDCHRAFLRAQALLAEYVDQRNSYAARLLVLKAGELALDENEAWLLAHRERPVRPVT